MTQPGDAATALDQPFHGGGNTFTRAVLDSLVAHVAVVDGDGTIVMVNRAWEAFALANGCAGFDGVGTGANYLAVCDNATGEWADEGAVVAAALREVLAGARSSFALEYPCHSPSEQRWFHVSITPLAGATPGAVIAHHDVSERVRAEHERDHVFDREQAARRRAERIADQNARLYAVTSALSAAVEPEDVARVVVDQCLAEFGGTAGALLRLTPDGAYLEVVYTTGYDEAVTAPWQRFPLDRHVMIADALRARTPLYYGTAESYRTAYPEVASAIDASGNQAFVAIPILFNDRIFGGIALSFGDPRTFSQEDRAFATVVAEQCAQALERARLYRESQRAVEARSDLLSTVSHDLRTPLTTIKGMAQLLARSAQKSLGEQAQPYIDGLERIDATTTRMTALIDELLDGARLRAGEPLELHRAPADLVALVRRAIDEHQQSTTAHQITLNTTTDKLEGVWDAPRLGRVVDNVLSNAVKYSPEGGNITVSIELDAIDASTVDDGTAVVTVADQGIGIPSNDLPYVFERFRRAENVRDRITGTGIGLAGAKQIVEQHGGSLMVTSVEGQGTTVIVRLPLLAAEDDRQGH